MAIKDTLINKDGVEIYPQTVTDNVFDSEGNRLDNTIEQINNDLSELQKSTLGTEVDLKNNSGAGSWFGVPADGYVSIATIDKSSSSTAYQCYIFDISGFVLCSVRRYQNHACAFVKKGMKIYYTNDYYNVGTDCFIKYRPLT